MSKENSQITKKMEELEKETEILSEKNTVSTIDKKSTNLIIKTLNRIIKKKPKVAKKENIVFFCAHNDDQLLGAGGTIKKYADEGKNVYTYIFSFGETSHPHIKPRLVARMREKESIEASKILGDRIQYFGIEEGKFIESITPAVMARIIRDKNPTKIFTHAPDDPHSDHQAVFKLSIEAAKRAEFEGDFYSFDIWNIFSFKTREFPKLFVDVSKTFKYKIKAFDEHKSQLNTKVTLGWSFYFKALMNGWNNHCKYAEVFHKINFEEYEFLDYLKNTKKFNKKQNKLKKKR